MRLLHESNKQRQSTFFQCKLWQVYRAPFGAGLSGTSQLGFPVREAHSFNSYSASQQKAVYKDPDVDQRTKEKQPQSGVLLFSRQSI